MKRSIIKSMVLGSLLAVGITSSAFAGTATPDPATGGDKITYTIDATKCAITVSSTVDVSWPDGTKTLGVAQTPPGSTTWLFTVPAGMIAGTATITMNNGDPDCDGTLTIVAGGGVDAMNWGVVSLVGLGAVGVVGVGAARRRTRTVCA